jgi:hypothetical protein
LGIYQHVARKGRLVMRPEAVRKEAVRKKERMTTYRIKDWHVNFENNRTRELKVLTWVPMPNKHDGDGYTELLDHADGAAHYGVWAILVQIASKCDPRGTLLRDVRRNPAPACGDPAPACGDPAPACDGGKTVLTEQAKCQIPHDFASLSRMSRIPQKVISAAIPRLLQIGWLEQVIEIPQEDATAPHFSAPPSQGSASEWNGMEWKGIEEKPPTPKGGDVLPPEDPEKIPEAIDTPEFRIAWNDWIADKKDRKERLTPRARKMQLERLGKFDAPTAIAMIQQSITNAWKGIFELKTDRGGNGQGVANRDGLKPGERPFMS